MTIGAQTGSFTLAFDTVPSQLFMDGVTGLSLGGVGNEWELATAIRFAPSGKIEVADGGSYRAIGVVSYSPGVTYRVVMTIDLEQRRYSVTVTPAGGAPVTVARNFAFQTGHGAATQLDTVSFLARRGAHSVTNVSATTEQ